MSQMRMERILSPDLCNGYLQIRTKTQGARKKQYVHRLVAHAFVDGFFESATVDHIDGDRTNNLASNLRWISRSENTKYQNADGRGAGKGERHRLAKLADSDIPVIRRMIAEGMPKLAIARQYGVSDALIYKIAKGYRT